jgi:hypothetical protein
MSPRKYYIWPPHRLGQFSKSVYGHKCKDISPTGVCKVSAPMIERNPWTAQPPHKINYENFRRNFRYVGHLLVKCDTAFKFAQCAVKGSLSFWDPPVYVWIQFVIAFINQNIFYFHFFVGESPLHKLTILQNLKQFKLVNLYLQGFEDWSCGHWRTYLGVLVDGNKFGTMSP